MLKELGVQSVQLLTNNPSKVYGLEEFGIKVIDRIPIQIEPNPINRFYLAPKARKSGHLINFSRLPSEFKLLKEVV